MADSQLQIDIDTIISACTGVGNLLDELTLLRTSLRLYSAGQDPADAVATACNMLSNSLTQSFGP